MDFTATISDISWGKGYEIGFRAGWDAHAELVESRERWEVKGEPVVASDCGSSGDGSTQRSPVRVVNA